MLCALTNGEGGGRKPSRELLLLSRGQGTKRTTWRVQDTQTLAIFERKFAHHLVMFLVIRKPDGMQMVKAAEAREKARVLATLFFLMADEALERKANETATNPKFIGQTFDLLSPWGASEMRRAAEPPKLERNGYARHANGEIGIICRTLKTAVVVCIHATEWKHWQLGDVTATDRAAYLETKAA